MHKMVGDRKYLRGSAVAHMYWWVHAGGRALGRVDMHAVVGDRLHVPSRVGGASDRTGSGTFTDAAPSGAPGPGGSHTAG